MNDLSAERLAAAAAVVGLAPIRVVAETGSTNADLRGAPLGTALVAGRQTAGRGRLGRVWEDAGDALLLSLRVGTSLPAERRALAALAAAIAVREACGEGYRIKWPNDVLDGADRKVAGILVEVDEGALIVGVGAGAVVIPLILNLLNQAFGFEGGPKGIRKFTKLLTQRSVPYPTPPHPSLLSLSLYRIRWDEVMVEGTLPENPQG